MRHSSGERSARRLTCAALPEPIDGFLITATIASSVAAISLTALTVAFSAPPQPPSRAASSLAENDDDAGFGWSVAGVVACIPLVSFIAWALPILSASGPGSIEPAATGGGGTSGTSDTSVQLYYAYAALYAAPLLRSGFDLDAYSLAMIMLCVVHVQVERIAAIEPETLRALLPRRAPSSLPPSTSRGDGAPSPSSLTSSQASQQASRLLGSAARSAAAGLERIGQALSSSDASGADEVDELSAFELQQFDQRLAQSQRKREQGGVPRAPIKRRGRPPGSKNRVKQEQE
ncbi:hypothetical protein FOA52_014912 [Chlamydomonas sp. UWO 241]|nr:hypothetical protein FOA52_014912 [Chlamydomonas sp. UWO 241]